MLMVVGHGDDFTVLGTKLKLGWFEVELAKAFDLKLKGRMGNRAGCVRELRSLNRILRLCSDGLRYEPDPQAR